MPFAVVLGLARFVLVLPLAAQTPEPSDESVGPLAESEAHSAALALYDADGDGTIDVDELLTAVDDHLLAGRIDKATARRVMELHIGGSLAQAAGGGGSDWARIACHWLGCGPLTPTPTPTDTPVAGPPYSPTPTHTSTPTHTPTPTDTPTPMPPLPPSPSPWTPSPTPIPRLSDPCGHYDFNGNGKIDKNEVDQAVSDEANGTLHRKDALAVVACYFAAPKPKPPPDPTATHTHTPTPGDTPTPTPGDTPTPTPEDTPTPVPGNPSPTPTPIYTPVVPITNPEFNVSIYRRTGANRTAWTKFKPADWKVLHRAVMGVSVTPKVAGTDLSDYDFNLIVNTAGTGFSVISPGDMCSSGDPETGWSNGDDYEVTSSQTHGREFTMVRCGLGEASNTGIKLKARPAGSTDASKVFTAKTIDGINQAWHSADSRITFSAYRIPDVRRQSDPDPIDVISVDPAIVEATSEWNKVNDIFALGSGTDVDVTISGYQYTSPSSGECGNGLACVKHSIDPSIDPHMGSQKMWIRYPPKGPNTQWTTVIDNAISDPEYYYYLTQILIHEFGHTAGLGHAIHGTVMYYKYENKFPIDGLTNEDKKGFKAVTGGHQH